MNSPFSVVALANNRGSITACRMLRVVVAPIFVLWLAIGTTFAFTKLNVPQTLIYDTSHLAKTVAGSVIAYSYNAIDTTNDAPIDDQVLLTVHQAHEEDRRDVSVDFLSGELRIPLPDFDKYRGNPVVIVMLEHLAQTLGRETEGGVLYFRNRIRDALADENLEVLSNDDADSPVKEFSITPLKNDPFVAGKPRLTQSVITLTFNDEIPGLLQSVVYRSGPSDKPELIRTLEFAGVDTK